MSDLLYSAGSRGERNEKALALEALRDAVADLSIARTRMYRARTRRELRQAERQLVAAFERHELYRGIARQMTGLAKDGD